MTAPLTREQFNVAVADAVTGILNVYREVDAMFRELTATLDANEPRLAPFTGRKALVPGASGKNPDSYYLRNYRAWMTTLCGAWSPALRSRAILRRSCKRSTC